MGARHHLNAIYVGGSLLASVIVGYLAGSWIVFLLVAIILIALSLDSGTIRPHSRGKRN